MSNKEKALELCNDPANDYKSTADLCIKMAEWKDEQFNEERKDLLALVKMLPVNENNQTIIEDLIRILK